MVKAKTVRVSTPKARTKLEANLAKEKEMTRVQTMAKVRK